MVVIAQICPIRILVDVDCWGKERGSYGWYQNAKKALESLVQTPLSNTDVLLDMFGQGLALLEGVLLDTA